MTTFSRENLKWPLSEKNAVGDGIPEAATRKAPHSASFNPADARGGRARVYTADEGKEGKKAAKLANGAPAKLLITVILKT